MKVIVLISGKQIKITWDGTHILTQTMNSPFFFFSPCSSSLSTPSPILSNIEQQNVYKRKGKSSVAPATHPLGAKARIYYSQYWAPVIARRMSEPALLAGTRQQGLDYRSRAETQVNITIRTRPHVLLPGKSNPTHACSSAGHLSSEISVPLRRKIKIMYSTRSRVLQRGIEKRKRWVTVLSLTVRPARATAPTTHEILLDVQSVFVS